MKKTLMSMVMSIMMVLVSCTDLPTLPTAEETPPAKATTDAEQYLPGTWIEETEYDGVGEGDVPFSMKVYAVSTYTEKSFSSEGHLTLTVQIPEGDAAVLRMVYSEAGTWSVRPNGTYEACTLECEIRPADEEAAELLGPGKSMAFVIDDIKAHIKKDPYSDGTLLDKTPNSYTFRTAEDEDGDVMFTFCKRVSLSKEASEVAKEEEETAKKAAKEEVKEAEEAVKEAEEAVKEAKEAVKEAKEAAKKAEA